MKTLTVKTNALNYAKKIIVVTDEYMDGTLYVGLYTTKGEPYADITTHIFGYGNLFPLSDVEENSEAEKFIKEQGFAKELGLVHGSGFNTYRTYDFSKLLEMVS